MRHVINIGLLLAFTTLATTGILAFSRPFSLTTTRVHVIFGLATLLLAGLHVLGRVSYFGSQWWGRTPAASRLRVILTTLGWAAVLVGGLRAVTPAKWLMRQSYEAQNSQQIVRSSSLVGFGEVSETRFLVKRKTPSSEIAELSLYVTFHDVANQRPAVAVWAETTTGTMIETLHLNSELAFADTVDWHGALRRRNHILPIWRNRYTAISGIGPDGKVDAVTGATDAHSFALDDYLAVGDDKKFVVCVEVNLPHDPTDAWPDPQIGQPSLIYTAYVKVDEDQVYAILELTGHGGGAESDGNLQYDLDQITTAKSIVDLILLKLEKPRRKR